MKPKTSLSPLKIAEYRPVMPYTLNSPANWPEMDPGIWSRMPAEILEHILSFLPLKTFLNLRSTCKHFRSLVFSPSFIAKHSSSSPSTPSSFSFLLLAHPQFMHRFFLYDCNLGTWRSLALTISLLVPRDVTAAHLPCCTLLSSSNGLLCFSLPSSSSFLVCNSLAKSSRVIATPCYPFSFESLTFVSTPCGYKIFVLCCMSTSISAFVYDSKIHSWQRFDGFGPNLSDSHHQEGVYFKGLLYFTTPEPISVVSFDLESGRLGRANTDLPGEITFARLVTDGESKLYLIGGIGRNGISRAMKLWELGDRGNWMEIQTVPEMMCKKFMSVCYYNYERMYCFWHQGMICLCCYTWPEILYYKVSRRTWHWLPRCSSLPEKWSCGFRFFSFVPELYALV
ncbi:hypothetical protein Tsubulata_038819 [Turnera subulata]|uniref:F-box domain-containing protein n=1 Tax=Turnera subulata TaxID=218843 RepID=A0A9Q0JN00_9ROSI|nr:hypothetical protein Tsubulata_038819 [Turnera subulata]